MDTPTRRTFMCAFITAEFRVSHRVDGKLYSCHAMYFPTTELRADAISEVRERSTCNGEPMELFGRAEPSYASFVEFILANDAEDLVEADF
jgi:hypothetical protein